MDRRFLVVMLCVFATACGSAGGGSEAVFGDDRSGVVDDDLIPCLDLNGRATEEIANHFDAGKPCGRSRGLDSLQALFPGLEDRDCGDGTFVYWNDAGYGGTEGTWTADLDGSAVFDSDIYRSCGEDSAGVVPSSTTTVALGDGRGDVVNVGVVLTVLRDGGYGRLADFLDLESVVVMAEQTCALMTTTDTAAAFEVALQIAWETLNAELSDYFSWEETQALAGATTATFCNDEFNRLYG